jgi:hypothetical protein
MRQAAGTAVLGVALAAAAVTPAAADGLGGVLGGLPAGGALPTSALPTSALPASGLLDSQTNSVHTVTGTAQGLVDSAAPSLQSVTQGAAQSAPAADAPSANRAMPVSLTDSLPVVGQLPAVSSLSNLGQQSAATTSGLNHLTNGLPVHTTFAPQ